MFKFLNNKQAKLHHCYLQKNLCGLHTYKFLNLWPTLLKIIGCLCCRHMMGLILGPLTLGWLPLVPTDQHKHSFMHPVVSLRFWGPSWQNFSHPQLFIQYQMISRFMFSSSAIIFSVNLQLDHSSSFTCAVLSSVHVVEGHLLCCLSSTRFLASENILCQ